MSSLILIGKITGVHGVKGLVEIKPFLNDAACFGKLNPMTNKAGTKTFEIKVNGQKKDVLLCQITGINDRTTAETMKGVEIYAPRSTLPKAGTNEFYYHDLIGMTVMRNNQKFGTITTVNNYGAGDILTIETVDNKTIELIFQKSTFPEIDMEKNIVHIVLPLGVKGYTDED